MNDRESYDIFSRCGDGTIVITTLPEKKNYRYHATDAEGMYRKVVELGKSTNVYISVNPRGDDLPDGARGGDDDVRQLLSIIADCDVFGEARAEKELPPDKDSVISLLTALPIKPTRLDDSGYGIYAWYIFEEPYRITDEKTLRKAKGITEGFGRYLASEFSKKGWKLDNVFSISHMFRAPGSLNHKLDTPVPCHMIDFSGTFYSIDDFEDYYKAPVAHSLYSMKEQTENLLAVGSLKAEDIYDPYTLKLASWATDNDPAAYGRLKLMVKKTGIGLRDFEKAVKHEAEMRAGPEFGIVPRSHKPCRHQPSRCRGTSGLPPFFGRRRHHNHDL